MCGRAKVAFRYRPLEHLIVAPAHNNLDFRARSKRGTEPSLCQSRNENSSGLVLSSVANGNIGKCIPQTKHRKERTILQFCDSGIVVLLDVACGH